MFKPYFEAMLKGGHIPNFWCSEEYMKHASCSLVLNPYFIGIQAPEGMWLVPPLSPLGHIMDMNKGEEVWSSFLKQEIDEKRYTTTLLDQNYIYTAKIVADMEGRKFSTFRKNVNKWEKENEDKYRIEFENPHVDECLALFEEWMPETVDDGMTIIEFIMKCPNRFLLFRENELLGFNLFDVNNHYVNFRYCFCKKEDYLSEFLRHIFFEYHRKAVQKINDGGDLGNSELARFKRKLNPDSVLPVYSYIAK
jgi:hypothetical protein